MDEPKLTAGKRMERALTVDHSDPDVARRGKLLNTILAGMFAAAVVSSSIGLIFNFLSGWSNPGELLVVIAGSLAVLFTLGLYFLSRRGMVRPAAVIFLLGLLVLVSFSDEPAELIAGRSTIAYVLPIVMASVLLGPLASFAIAALSSVALFMLALTNGLLSDLLFTIFVEIVIFFLVALVSWLSARSLEKALVDLRTVNAELDRRVADRTRDLAEALIRVQMESSKGQAILESIADGVIVFDGLGKATVVNPAICRLLNLPPDQIVGYRIETLMAGFVGVNDQKAVLDQLHHQDSATRLPGLRLQWGNKTLSASFAPIQIQQEAGRGTVAVLRDFTREAELDRMKTMFVSMVSHELRTPLGAIMAPRWAPSWATARSCRSKFTAR